MIACRKSFTDTLLSLARTDKDIIAVTTDARGSVTLNDFANELPQQFVECGIAEQNAVGISAGLAHSGKKVFVCGPACFYVARSLEQVKVDVAYSQNNVKIVGVSGGVAYGALGATHHSLHDIAVLRTFPGMQIVLPCDARQTKKLVRLLVDYPHPVIGRQVFTYVYDENTFHKEIGIARTFGFKREVEALWSMGLAKGGSLDNAIVIDDKEGVLNKEGLRFPNEFVRHKILDMFGDLALIGYRLQGKIKASKSGHHVNNVFARTLLEATNSYVIEEETESKVIKEQAASCQPYGSFSENIAASAV